MKNKLLSVLIVLTIGTHVFAQNTVQKQQASSTNKVASLKELLSSLASKSDNEFFTLHCKSILAVITSKTQLSPEDTIFLSGLYDAFNNDDKTNLENINTYLKRERELIVAWTSTSDGATSYTWFKLPKNWDPAKKYPLYVELHGHWDVADNPINHLTYPYLKEASTSIAFEDGYLISPWGRGNLWYQGISETDVLECITTIESLVSIDTTRRYLWGFSMGGYGTWNMGIKYLDKWAAIGLHDAAIQSFPIKTIEQAVNTKLSAFPVYQMCGDKDYGIKERADEVFKLLKDAGNKNIEYSIFEGEHTYSSSEVEKMYLWMKQFKK